MDGAHAAVGDGDDLPLPSLPSFARAGVDNVNGKREGHATQALYSVRLALPSSHSATAFGSDDCLALADADGRGASANSTPVPRPGPGPYPASGPVAVAVAVPAPDFGAGGPKLWPASEAELEADHAPSPAATAPAGSLLSVLPTPHTRGHAGPPTLPNPADHPKAPDAPYPRSAAPPSTAGAQSVTAFTLPSLSVSAQVDKSARDSVSCRGSRGSGSASGSASGVQAGGRFDAGMSEGDSGTASTSASSSGEERVLSHDTRRMHLRRGDGSGATKGIRHEAQLDAQTRTPPPARIPHHIPENPLSVSPSPSSSSQLQQRLSGVGPRRSVQVQHVAAHAHVFPSSSPSCENEHDVQRDPEHDAAHESDGELLAAANCKPPLQATVAEPSTESSGQLRRLTNDSDDSASARLHLSALSSPHSPSAPASASHARPFVCELDVGMRSPPTRAPSYRSSFQGAALSPSHVRPSASTPTSAATFSSSSAMGLLGADGASAVPSESATPQLHHLNLRGAGGGEAGIPTPENRFADDEESASPSDNDQRPRFRSRLPPAKVSRLSFSRLSSEDVSGLLPRIKTERVQVLSQHSHHSRSSVSLAFAPSPLPAPLFSMSTPLSASALLGPLMPIPLSSQPAPADHLRCLSTFSTRAPGELPLGAGDLSSAQEVHEGAAAFAALLKACRGCVVFTGNEISCAGMVLCRCPFSFLLFRCPSPSLLMRVRRDKGQRECAKILSFIGGATGRTTERLQEDRREDNGCSTGQGRHRGRGKVRGSCKGAGGGMRRATSRPGGGKTLDLQSIAYLDGDCNPSHEAGQKGAGSAVDGVHTIPCFGPFHFAECWTLSACQYPGLRRADGFLDFAQGTHCAAA